MQDNSPLRVVSIGGGTGLSSVLQGLKHYARADGRGNPGLDITAIVTVTDDGGSSGRLRREFDVLPPGDIRNCMVALSEDSALLSRLFQYRFQSRPRAQGTQLRQSIPHRTDAYPGRFSGCHEGFIGSAQDRRAHLPQHGSERGDRGYASQRQSDQRREPDQPQPRTHTIRCACIHARLRLCRQHCPRLPKPT